MPNLLPQFIYTAHQRQQRYGQVEAIALFVDVSGFTSLTERLMAASIEGAEQLSVLLNTVFEPLLTEIYTQGGEVVRFFGDALLALFPLEEGQDVLEVTQRALYTAVRIRARITRQPEIKTAWGTLRLAVKQGLARGTAVWGIIGPAHHLVFYVHGTAVSRATQGEQEAQPSEILLHHQLALTLPPAHAQLTRNHDSDYWRLDYLPRRVTPRTAAPPVPQQALSILRQFFPHVVQFLDRQGEFRTITAIFLSFEGEGGHLDQQKLAYFATQLITTASKYGGYLSELSFGDKTDLFLLYFGAPISYENNSVRALSFLLDLQQQTTNQKPRWRAGVTAGPVYAGLLGAAWRTEYKTMGATVNLAARLMTKAGWGEVLVSREVSQTVGFRFKGQGAFVYKGFATPQPTYALRGWQNRRTLPTAVSPLVGRTAELQSLEEHALTAFSQPQATAVLILGEPGIGKSHLVHTLRSRLHSKNGIDLLNQATAVAWFTAPTDQILRQPLNPIRYALSRYFRQDRDIPQRLNAQRFQAVWGQLYNRLRQEQAEELPTLYQQLERAQPYLESFLDLPLTGELPAQVTARGRYLNLLNAIVALFKAESALQPIVLELDDYHWLDAATPELLKLLMAQLDSVPFLLLITSRYTDNGQPPNLPFPVHHIHLSPLSPTAVQEQIQHLLRGQPNPALAKLLQEKGQANPLFIQQMLLHLQDNGLIHAQEGQEEPIWLLTEPDTAVPSALSTILTARLDRLPLAVQQLVKNAAVLGQEVQLRILQEIMPGEIETLAQQAEQAQIWTKLDQQRYRFRHVLLRDVVYEMQSVAQRRRLHQQAAYAYETLYQADLSRYYAELAYHYGVAQDQSGEARYTMLAGIQASERFAHEDALRWLNRALQLTPPTDLAREYALLAQRVKVYDLQGGRTQQADDLVRLMALAVQLGTAEQIETALRISDYYEIGAEYAQAKLAAQQAIQWARAAGQTQAEAEGYILHGRVLWRTGEYNAARTEFQHAYHLAAQVTALAVQSASLRMLGMIAVDTDQKAEALAYFEQAVTLARAANDVIAESFSLNNLAITYYRSRDFFRALHYFQQAYDIALEIGDQRGLVLFTGNLAVSMMNLGDFAQAYARQKEKVAMAKAGGARNELCASLATISYIRHTLGDHMGAIKAANESLALAQELKMTENEAYALTYRGRTYLWLGDFMAAKADLTRAYEIRQRLKMYQRSLEPLALLADTHFRLEDMPQAIATVEELLPWLEPWQLQATHDPFVVPLVCYRVLTAVGQTNRADHILTLAWQQLQVEINQIDDPHQRELFQKIPAHATLAQLVGYGERSVHISGIPSAGMV